MTSIFLGILVSLLKFMLRRQSSAANTELKAVKNHKMQYEMPILPTDFDYIRGILRATRQLLSRMLLHAVSAAEPTAPASALPTLRL